MATPAGHDFFYERLKSIENQISSASREFTFIRDNGVKEKKEERVLIFHTNEFFTGGIRLLASLCLCACEIY